MQFCPKCDNIMDIGKTAPRSTFTQEPTSLSITTVTTIDKDEDEHITKIINMSKNELDISNEKFDIDKVMKHKDFLNMKDREKKDFTKILKALEDDSMTAFIVCKNCSYSEKLTKRTLILNKMSNFAINTHSDLTKYKYMRYDNTLPHTRDYVCKNKECNTQKDDKLKNAKWFRPIQNSYLTYYVCCECGTVWNIG